MDPAVVALAVLLVAASIADLRSRRIPNLLIGFGLCIGFGLAWSAMGLTGLWFATKGALVGLALFFPLFLLRAFGAGDVKLMMVVGSLVGAPDAVVIAMIALVAGGTLALVSSIAGRRFAGMLTNLRATVFALASRDFETASGLAQATAYRVPFAIPMLVGAAAWLYYFY